MSIEFPHLFAGGEEKSYSILREFLHILFPHQTVEWTTTPNLGMIDTYVLFYSTEYEFDEVAILTMAVRNAKKILERGNLPPNSNILIILYRNLKVSFPDRKLQREKEMSNLLSEKIFQQEDIQKERIQIVHEFGTNQLQDSFQFLRGKNFFFEIN